MAGVDRDGDGRVVDKPVEQSRASSAEGDRITSADTGTNRNEAEGDERATGGP